MLTRRVGTVQVLNPKPPPPLIIHTDGTGRVTTPELAATSTEATPLPPTVAENWAKIARMKQCEAWQKATDCGCGVNRCTRGRGREGLVRHEDCFRCPDLPPET